MHPEKIYYGLAMTLLLLPAASSLQAETDESSAQSESSVGTAIVEHPMAQPAAGALAGGLLWGVDGAVVGGLLGASSYMANEASKVGRTVVSQEEFDSTQTHQQQAAEKFNNRQSGTVNRVQASGKVYRN